MSEDNAAPAAAEQGSRNLLVRVLAALVLAPLAIAIAYSGGWLWATLVTLASIGLYVEWLMIIGLAREVAEGKRDPASVDADALGQYLDAPDIPDPDLIIRTSGEQRLSNFLMWQAAYSELVFVPIHWPDFDKAALESAIAEYARREHRFGGLAAKTGS